MVSQSCDGNEFRNREECSQAIIVEMSSIFKANTSLDW